MDSPASTPSWTMPDVPCAHELSDRAAAELVPQQQQQPRHHHAPTTTNRDGSRHQGTARRPPPPSVALRLLTIALINVVFGFAFAFAFQSWGIVIGLAVLWFGFGLLAGPGL